MPGFYVFPGGAVDEREASARKHIIGPEETEIDQIMSLGQGGADYMLAAIRECFEEAGILLAADENGKLVGESHKVHTNRNAVFEGKLTLDDLCQQHKLTIPLDRLAYLSRWTTPPGLPRRFDARFFVATAPDDQPASHDGIETIDHVWIDPAEALEDHRCGRRLLGLPTLRTLRILSDFDNTDTLMRYAHANPPDPYPEKAWPAIRKGRPVTLEPGAPAYDEATKLDPEGEGSVSAEITPGLAVQVAAGVIRLTAGNSGMMTGPGTNTYIVGHERFTVIDPGPDNQAHIDRILELTGSRIERVLVTHTHLDHSPGAHSLKLATNCLVWGQAAPNDATQDTSFSPDAQPVHGDLIDTDAGQLKVIHTPGHASNHLCFLLEDQELLFAGDHIMQGSTVVINPPDGDMKAYIESLYDLLDEPIRFIAPGHGFLMGQPEAVIDYLITHRLAREYKVTRALERHAPASLKDLTAEIYNDVPTALHGVAARSALAHLLKLKADGRAHEKAGLWHTTAKT
jgi:glyoxylase-like metal-dependent hydrolase (beta-lactamase superfamily II)/8-oxo-dGTP pyrophosphatase MutT (NUDIX family)